MVTVKLLNGSRVVHAGAVACMGCPNDLTVIVHADGMIFEAWNLERHGDYFITSSWKRTDTGANEK